MKEEEKLGQIRALRHAFGVNGRLRIEFLGMVSQLLRAHGIEVAPDLLGDLHLAVRAEIRDPGEGGRSSKRVDSDVQ
jgi:hypothetical protein